MQMLNYKFLPESTQVHLLCIKGQHQKDHRYMTRTHYSDERKTQLTVLCGFVEYDKCKAFNDTMQVVDSKPSIETLCLKDVKDISIMMKIPLVVHCHDRLDNIFFFDPCTQD